MRSGHTTSQYVACPFHSQKVGRASDDRSVPATTSAGGTYQVGGWLVSSTLNAEVDSAMTAPPDRTTINRVDGRQAGGRG